MASESHAKRRREDTGRGLAAAARLRLASYGLPHGEQRRDKRRKEEYAHKLAHDTATTLSRDTSLTKGIEQHNGRPKQRAPSFYIGIFQFHIVSCITV